MAITAQEVNQLRQKTGAGMMDCKKALTEANGDFDKAIEILRKKGAAVAAKRAERAAKEGLVLTKVIDNKKAIIVEVNCETDFVAKSPDFINFATNVLNTVADKAPANVEALLGTDDVQNQLTDLIGKVGEKIEVSRFEIVDADFIIDYIHPGSKLGVLVLFADAAADEKTTKLGKDIAMQTAAMRPICTFRTEVPKELIEKEIDIYKELARKENKPEAMLEKIALGKLNKYYGENCLSEQAFVKNDKLTIAQLIEEHNKQNGSNIKLVGFKRFQLGEDKK